MRGISLNSLIINAAQATALKTLAGNAVASTDFNETISENSLKYYGAIPSSDVQNFPFSGTGLSNALLNIGLHSTTNRNAQIAIAHKRKFQVRSSQEDPWEEMITSGNIDSYIKKYLDTQA